MPVRADTDGILDNCAECGGIPGWEEADQSQMYRARCTDCPNIGEWKYSEYEASVAWNVAQRKNKGLGRSK